MYSDFFSFLVSYTLPNQVVEAMLSIALFLHPYNCFMPVFRSDVVLLLSFLDIFYDSLFMIFCVNYLTIFKKKIKK